MAKIYLSGTVLPESYSEVRNGLAVVLDKPSEVDGLKALCALAPRPPEDPMVSLYRSLSEPSLDLATWAVYWKDLRPFRPNLPETPVPSSLDNTAKLDSVDMIDEPPQSLLGKLQMALDVAKPLWEAQGDEVSELRLVVLVAEPGLAGRGGLSFDGEGAALVIRPGSLLGELVCKSLRVPSFAVCLMLGGGTSTTARRPEMVSRLRTEAAKSQALGLEDLRGLRPGDKLDSLVVLVHGLFATDVGTFKTLQSRLQKSFTQVVGFPHDTLTQSIGTNGFELAQHLDKLNYSRIYCVAHSRGGLVVRSAAVNLAKRQPARVKIDRCVTFGTPHLGAEMAENPGSLIALMAFLKASALDRSVASVVDMLCCATEKCGFPGIEDLRPANTSDTWLAKLQDEECRLPPKARMDVFAVGGNKRATKLLERVAGFTASRIMGRKKSDLVVAQESSVPPFLEDSQDVECDHFSYFQEQQAGTLDKVVKWLKKA